MRHRRAAITGASSGIGAALAKALATETDLLLSGRDVARLEALARDLSAPGRRIEIAVADLGTDAGTADFIRAAAAFEPDLLINNAGLGKFGPILSGDPADEAAMVRVNVLAPVEITRALVPDMIARAKTRGGRAGVIITASVVSFMPFPSIGTYAATKAFDLHYAEALAAELAREPIDVLALCPGSTETDFHARAGMGDMDRGPKATADRVAREGLAALGRRSVHVVGAGNRVMTLLPRLLPRGVVRAIIARATRT